MHCQFQSMNYPRNEQYQAHEHCSNKKNYKCVQITTKLIEKKHFSIYQDVYQPSEILVNHISISTLKSSSLYNLPSGI